MAPSTIMIDTFDSSIDFSPFSNFARAKATATTTTRAGRNLLLAPPSVAAHEEKLRAVYTAFDQSSTDLHMLDRLSAGLGALPPATYDLVLVLTDADGARRDEALALLSRDVYAMLVPSMTSGGQLEFQHGRLGPIEAREAILAGLVETDGGVFEKVEEEEVVMPLRLGAKKKQQPPPPTSAPRTVELDLGEYEDGDELIDEDDLLSEEDMTRGPQQPPKCLPNGGPRPRKPCKDCTCGLAERTEAKDRARQAKAASDLSSMLKLKSDDLNELDFTVKGKTGSCNSCSLGDAFRCSDCPYIGLPPFKPGEEVKILNNAVQL